MTIGRAITRGRQPRTLTLVQIFSGLALLSTMSGCIVVPAYPPPPPRYHYYYYGY
ncbi:MAG TPA: hypothetical protein VEJ16_10475 [Alphaproteobacteria bacterium]|nr:hypothetical protein [Alphaproteobacteria bacterium]